MSIYAVITTGIIVYVTLFMLLYRHKYQGGSSVRSSVLHAFAILVGFTALFSIAKILFRENDAFLLVMHSLIAVGLSKIIFSNKDNAKKR